MTTWIRKYEPANLQFTGTCPECGCGLHGAECSNTNCGSRRKAHGIPQTPRTGTEETAPPLGSHVPANGKPGNSEMICPACRQKLYIVTELNVCINPECEQRMKSV